MSKGRNVPREIWHFPKGPCASGLTGELPCTVTKFSPDVIEEAKNRAENNPGIISSKVIVVGDVGVGKTSLVNRFSRNAFNNDYKATIGVDFEIEAFNILGLPFHLQIWDTAGQERFRSLAAAYYRGADCLIVTYDMTDKESLNNAMRWKECAMEAIVLRVPVFLVGAKKDLAESFIQSAWEEGAEIAKAMNAEFWTTSASSGENVNEFFHRVAALAFEAKLKQKGSSLSLGSVTNLKHTDVFETKRKEMCSCII